MPTPEQTAEGQGQPGGFDGRGDPLPSGLAYPSNVIKIGKNREALGHGAAFPCALPEFFVRLLTDSGDVVFDPFGGSGTTLIACQRFARKGRAIDLSPEYCEIACRRVERFADLVAVRVA